MLLECQVNDSRRSEASLDSRARKAFVRVANVKDDGEATCDTELIRGLKRLKSS